MTERQLRRWSDTDKRHKSINRRFSALERR